MDGASCCFTLRDLCLRGPLFLLCKVEAYDLEEVSSFLRDLEKTRLDSHVHVSWRAEIKAFAMFLQSLVDEVYGFVLVF
jgi:hypothetical protein